MDYRPIFRNPVLPWVLLLPTFLVLVIFLYFPALQSGGTIELGGLKE